MRTKLLLGAAVLLLVTHLHAASNAVLGWNNLGMHCMDSDYSVLSVLPPYNTVEAQLIVGGKLVTNGTGYRITYEAVADATGSFNSTAMGKGNFYTWAQALYGAALGPEQGLAGWVMPGPGNTPIDMVFERTNVPAPGVATRVNWFRAEGIPITPYDDLLRKNPYPLMRLVAWNGSQRIATNDVVLPVSDEMDCRMCHASGTQAAAQPAAGWVWDGLPERDYRLNILRLHDETEFATHGTLYRAALAARGFNPAGLYRSVTVDSHPVLCATCHSSEALGTPSFGDTPALTASMHSYHAGVNDPVLGTTLGDSANRAACYRCHPGAETKCLRGVMGAAPGPDGAAEIHCQSCHGNMGEVGKSSRVGWFQEPTCQGCHTGNAVNNAGAIRFTTVFTNAAFGVRQVSNLQFGTTPNTPAGGLSLYRFSAGHGGLQCSACHGSTHAEFPSTHANDNRRNEQLQGHAGVMVECRACHTVAPNSGAGGPHGLHAIDQGWVNGSDAVTKHADVIDLIGGPASCQPCHGVDYRGTELSRAQTTRNYTNNFDGVIVQTAFFRGAEIGCYNCHQGPFESNPNTAAAPVVSNLSTNTTNDQSLTVTLGSPAAGLAWRIISQPVNGSVGLTNNLATYYPAAGWVGTEWFTFAAYNGAKNSALATGTVSVAQGPYGIGVAVYSPGTYPANWPVPFRGVPTVTNHSGSVSFEWNFGDGSPVASGLNPTHVYSAPGSYNWSLVARVGEATMNQSGTVAIGQPVKLSVSRAGGNLSLMWPQTVADTVLEYSTDLGPGSWSWVTNAPVAGGGMYTVVLPSDHPGYFRVRRPW